MLYLLLSGRVEFNKVLHRRLPHHAWFNPLTPKGRETGHFLTIQSPRANRDVRDGICKTKKQEQDTKNFSLEKPDFPSNLSEKFKIGLLLHVILGQFFRFRLPWFLLLIIRPQLPWRLPKTWEDPHKMIWRRFKAEWSEEGCSFFAKKISIYHIYIDYLRLFLTEAKMITAINSINKGS